MTLDSTVLVIANHPVSLLEVVGVAAAMALLLLLMAVVMAWRSSNGRVAEQADAARRTADLEMRLAELSGSLQSFAAQAQGNTVHLQRTLDERLDAVSQTSWAGSVSVLASKNHTPPWTSSKMARRRPMPASSTSTGGPPADNRTISSNWSSRPLATG